MCYIYTMEYNAIKRNNVDTSSNMLRPWEIMPVPEDIILYDAIYKKYPEQANPETNGRLVIAKDWNEKEGMTSDW